jgi:hypothetical protein
MTDKFSHRLGKVASELLEEVQTMQGFVRRCRMSSKIIVGGRRGSTKSSGRGPGKSMIPLKLVCSDTYEGSKPKHCFLRGILRQNIEEACVIEIVRWSSLTVVLGLLGFIARQFVKTAPDNPRFHLATPTIKNTVEYFPMNITFTNECFASSVRGALWRN